MMVHMFVPRDGELLQQGQVLKPGICPPTKKNCWEHTKFEGLFPTLSCLAFENHFDLG